MHNIVCLSAYNLEHLRRPCCCWLSCQLGLRGPIAEVRGGGGIARWPHRSEDVRLPAYRFRASSLINLDLEPSAGFSSFPPENRISKCGDGDLAPFGGGCD